ncbi:hypothetical protein [Maribacter sp. 2307ULW6-5]|uniref:hypothetical protein n=1 Tax=Maribacter sp. 2307ULW6-5 TaxID=3386275 RepID=UPI0039BC45C2
MLRPKKRNATNIKKIKDDSLSVPTTDGKPKLFGSGAPGIIAGNIMVFKGMLVSISGLFPAGPQQGNLRLGHIAGNQIMVFLAGS